MISSKKMISADFTRQGFVSVETLPETERLNSTLSTETILPNIDQSMSAFRRKMQAQGSWIHIDNTKPHNSALSLQKTEQLESTRLVQRSCFPDLAPCNFFLFDYLKKEFHGKNFRSQNEVISRESGVIKIPIQMLSRVFDKWIERLNECRANEEEQI
jgi:hypothetical protein